MQDNIGDFWATTAQYCQMSDKSIIYKYVKPKKLVNMAFFKKPHHIIISLCVLSLLIQTVNGAPYFIVCIVL